MKIFTIFSILLLSSCIYAYDNCKLQFQQKSYDFNRFNYMSDNSHLYEGKIGKPGNTDQTIYKVYVDFCRQSAQCKVGSATCSIGNGVEYNLGSTTGYNVTALGNGMEGGIIEYYNGDSSGCPANRKTKIFMKCSNSATVITNVYEPSPCVYEITVESYFACPIPKDEPKCIFTGSNTKNYDLTPLKPFIYNGKIDGKAEIFSYSICGSYLSCNLPQTSPGACTTAITTGTTPQESKSAGLLSTYTISSINTGVFIQYTSGSGSGCSGSLVRSTDIQINCNQTVSTSEIVSIQEVSNCNYLVKMNSKHACPLN